jgi:hypothetical protein
MVSSVAKGKRKTGIGEGGRDGKGLTRMRRAAKGGEGALSVSIDADEGALVAGGVAVVGGREDGDAETIVLYGVTSLTDFVASEDGGDTVGFAPALGD